MAITYYVMEQKQFKHILVMGLLFVAEEIIRSVSFVYIRQCRVFHLQQSKYTLYLYKCTECGIDIKFTSHKFCKNAHKSIEKQPFMFC